MIQPINPEELNKFSDLLTDHLSDLTAELKVCTDTKVNKLLRGEVSNVTSMINGLSKHKLFSSSYIELTSDSSEDEAPLPIKPKAPKKAGKERIMVESPREPIIIAKVAKKRMSGTIRNALLRVK
jgi:hypothetical protein